MVVVPKDPAQTTLRRLTVIVALQWMGATLGLPLLPLFLEHRGGTASVVGLVMASFFVAGVATQFAFGHLADRFGRRKLLMVSLVVYGFASMTYLFPLAAPWFVATRVLQGAAAGAIEVTSLSAVSSLFPEAKRGRAVSQIFAAQLFGIAIGPVAGVLRWSTRVGAFLLSITARYPPFTLEPDTAYPVDVVLERPARSNRLYALFTVIVQAGLFVAGIAFVVYLIHHGSSTTVDNNGNVGSARFDFGSPPGGSGLALREIAALPHLIVLAVLGIAALVVWIVVQWVILFRAVYPRGMFDFTAGVIRWQTRVSGYTLGLSDRYPPFTFESSTGQTATGPAPAAWGARAVPGAGIAAARLVCRSRRAPHSSLLGRRAVDPARGRRRADLLRPARGSGSAGRGLNRAAVRAALCGS